MQLTKRQREVARCFYEGRCTLKEISAILHLDPSTVMYHLSAVYKALKVKNKIDLFHFIKTHPDIIKDPQIEPVLNYKIESIRAKSRRLKTAFLIAQLRDNCKDSEVKKELTNIISTLALPLR